MRTKFRSRDRGSGSKNAAVRVATRVFSGSTGIACEIGAGAATISQWGARSTIYDNGPINGTTDAWAINFGFVISDTFTTGGGSVDGMTFGAWLYPGDTLTSAELSITSSPNGGTSYFDQTVTFTQEGCTGNQFGFNVCTVSTSFTGPQLPNGMYWVNLQNASVPSGDPVYWDENSGMGCESNGCPSQASDNVVGTIPSESFTMQGSNGQPECFEPGGNLQVLYNFTPEEGGANGITIDKAGNLYGTSPTSGDNSAGFAFKLARLSGWLLDPLFSFFGGNTGGRPTGVIVGPNGSLYGGALWHGRRRHLPVRLFSLRDGVRVVSRGGRQLERNRAAQLQWGRRIGTLGQPDFGRCRKSLRHDWRRRHLLRRNSI